jgi:protein TonB
MSVFKGALLGLILFSCMSCENTEKKVSPVTSAPKAEVHPTPKVISPSKTHNKSRRIIPMVIPMILMDPEPPGPGPDPIPYDPGEPPVVCPTVDPVVIKTDSIYDYPAVMPEFPGGQQALINYIQSNMVYPEDAKELGIEGKVFVSFVIFEDGSIQQVSILRGISGNKSCEIEALRLMKRMPKWTPGKNEQGKAIKVRMKIPVVFSLY